jgi:trehalose 6-phosphate synthase
MAIDRFFENNPQYLSKMVFIQAGVVSRVSIEAYKDLNIHIEKLVEEINWKYRSERWKPIILLRENLPQTTLLALRRMADFCIVSALHDGMNLVAKEYVASRFDEDGVLILSPFAGSSRELTDALLINPYATDHFAEAIKTARRCQLRNIKRMQKWAVSGKIISTNGRDIISDLLKFEFGE